MAGLTIFDLCCTPDWTNPDPVPLGITDTARRIMCFLRDNLCSDVLGIILGLFVESVVLADHFTATRICLAVTKNKFYAEPYWAKHATSSWIRERITNAEWPAFWAAYYKPGLPILYHIYIGGTARDEDLFGSKYLMVDEVREFLKTITHPWVRERTLRYIELASRAKDS